MAAMYTSLKLISSKSRNYTNFSYDLIVKYKNGLYSKPTPFVERLLVSNGAFNQSGSTIITTLPSGKHQMSLKFIIKYDNKAIGKEWGKKSKIKEYGITTHPLKTTHGITTTDQNYTVSVPVSREKNKFIIICGGRGLGRHNVGANFLNCAKYHIEEIKKNAYPDIPRFDPSTCEIVSHIDVYNMGGYTIFTENDGTKESPPDSGNYVLDKYYNKPVPKGEMHRINELFKVFTNYKKIKYIAYFGHSWSKPGIDGYLLIGDRNTNNTNLLKKDVSNIETTNVLTNAQFRFFGCRSACIKDDDGSMIPIAQIFAQHFRGRACYGWASEGGSIFTHDKKLGHTGIQTKVDPNTQKVDTNRKISWLTANGKPEGWKVFKN